MGSINILRNVLNCQGVLDSSQFKNHPREISKGFFNVFIYVPEELHDSDLGPISPLLVIFRTSIHCHQLPMNLLIRSKEWKTLCNLGKPKVRTALVNSHFSGTGKQLQKLFSISNLIEQFLQKCLSFQTMYDKYNQKAKHAFFSPLGAICCIKLVVIGASEETQPWGHLDSSPVRFTSDFWPLAP